MNKNVKNNSDPDLTADRPKIFTFVMGTKGGVGKSCNEQAFHLGSFQAVANRMKSSSVGAKRISQAHARKAKRR